MVVLQPWYLELRQTRVVDPIMQDPRETGAYQTRLGKPTSWIFNTAIGGGQADFDQPVANLTPRDRALLYAFFNQKGHVEELVHAFTKLWPDPGRIRGCTVVDVGCGPFTAGLALANVVGASVPYRYCGVDRAKSMLTLGKELAEAARQAGALHERTSVEFFSEVSELPRGKLSADPVFVVLSYLLASSSLDVSALTADVLAFCSDSSLGSVGLLYTNSTRAEARKKYPELRKRLADAGFHVNVEDEETLSDGSKPRHVHYALFHRPAPAELSTHWLIS